MSVRRSTFGAALLVTSMVVVLLVSTFGGGAGARRKAVRAVLRDTSGNVVGVVNFRPHRGATGVSAEAWNLAPGFHGFHVSVGVLFLLIVARKVWRGDFDEGRRGFFTSQRGRYETVETMGLYWHFVDLVWIVLFTIVYLI
jgi:hypothetical protein